MGSEMCIRDRSSGANSVNIPKLAATSGTLSITADAKPKRTINKSNEIVSFNIVANTNNNPKDSRAATANKIHRKNNILGNSIFVNALCTGLSWCLDSFAFPSGLGPVA